MTASGAQQLLRKIFANAVIAARGEDIIASRSHFAADRWTYSGSDGVTSWDIPRNSRLIIIGAGKAAASLAKGMERVFGNRINSGCIVVKYGHTEKLEYIKQIEAGHPIPDENSVHGTLEILKILENLNCSDRVFVLLTGGSSSLLTAPAKDIALCEKAEISDLLIRCGAPIDKINVVRRALSRVKGGNY